MEEISDAQAHAVLLSTARVRVADGVDFTLGALLTDTGVSRAQFRRCFSGKKALLAALVQSDARALGRILDVAQPVAMQQAVGSDVAATPAPTDAWLERRLRVFERALTGLEKRQDKSEQDIGRQLALLEEKLGALAIPAAAPAPLAPPAQEELVFDPADSNLLPAEAPGAAPLEPAAAPVTVSVAPAGDAQPITEKEMADFIAHARQAARKAVPPPPPRKRRRRQIREAMMLAAILIGGVLVIGTTLLLASAGPRAMPIAGISRRQDAQDASARMIALADSGNADAQTALAQAYLRSDTDAARRWSKAAAAQGQPVAQYLLGTLYLEARDPGEAVRWLGAAAGQGNVKAMHNLAIAYAQGQGVSEDASLAVQWFARAAALGYRDSQFDLAVLYERGMGVPQNAALALKWYLIAAAQGDAPSAARAAVLRQEMDPSEARLAAAEAAGFAPLAMHKAANEAPRS